MNEEKTVKELIWEEIEEASRKDEKPGITATELIKKTGKCKRSVHENLKKLSEKLLTVCYTDKRKKYYKIKEGAQLSDIPIRILNNKDLNRITKKALSELLELELLTRSDYFTKQLFIKLGLEDLLKYDERMLNLFLIEITKNTIFNDLGIEINYTNGKA
ncbi:MAG: hypothetical protein ACTSP5_10005, partial [Candidatus Heimdallarchaeota archaeon]